MRRMNLGIGMMLILLCTTTLLAQSKTDQFFPDSTKGYIAISNMPEVRNEWRKTEIGQISLSEPFKEYRTAVVNSIEKRLGLSLLETLDLASGEVAFGLIAAPGQEPGFAMAVDITNKKKEAEDFMGDLIRRSFESKNGTSKKENLKIGKNVISVTGIDLPPDKDHNYRRTAFYVIIENYLIAAEQKDLIVQLLTCTKPLASVPAYKMSIQRCTADYASPHEPQIRYFLQPLEFGKAVSIINNRGKKKESSENGITGETAFDILANHGLNAITGVGGTLDFATEDMEFVSRNKIYMPENIKRDDLFSFIDEPKLDVPDWVDASISSATILNLDLLNLFNKVGPLFDDFVKTKNLWEDTLRGLEEDEGGPKVNLKTQLVGNLTSQITTFRRTVNDKEAFVGGIKVKPGKEEIIAEVFHRMFDTDTDFQQIPYGSGTIWAYSPQPKRQFQSRSRRSPISSAAAEPAPAAKKTDGKSATPEKQPKFIKNAFYVGDGNIFFSDNVDALKDVIENKRSGSVKPLANTKTYQLIEDYIQRFSGSGHSAQYFTADNEAIKTNYNLIRNGKFMEGDTILSRTFQRIYDGKEVNSPILENGSKLPPFETVQDRLGAGGAFGKNEPDGFFIKGFGLGPNYVR